MTLVRRVNLMLLTLLVVSPCFSAEYQAFEAIKKVALEFNDAGSQFLLGHMYYHGQGVEKNAGEAAKWFTLAAEQNYTEAFYFLGVMYVQGEGVLKDVPKGAAYLEKSGNDERALYKLGKIYLEGQGLKRDTVKALRNFQKAAEIGHTPSAVLAGKMIANGWGTAANAAKAVKLWQRASDLTEAQFYLGESYFLGRGVTQDYSRALHYLNHVSPSEFPWAAYYLGRIYGKGLNAPVDMEKALALLQTAAQGGVKEAMALLAELNQANRPEAFDQAPDAEKVLALKGDVNAQYKMGLRNLKRENRDVPMALQWLDKAATGGHRKAQLLLGEIYLNGVVIEQQYQSAFKWYLQAAQQQDPYAQFRIGTFFHQGLGVSKDLAQAQAWATKAQENGYSDAGELLGQIKNELKQKAAARTLAVDDPSHPYYELYKKALVGNAGAQYQFAMAMVDVQAENGAKVVADFLGRAANQGLIDAQIQLGHLYRDGNGVEQNFAIAARWYLKAAQNNSSEAQYQLGSLYEQWSEMRKSKDFAKKWYQRAADNGHILAKTALQQLP